MRNNVPLVPVCSFKKKSSKLGDSTAATLGTAVSGFNVGESRTCMLVVVGRTSARQKKRTRSLCFVWWRQFVQLGEISGKAVADVFTCIVYNDGGDSCGGVRSLPDKVWGRVKRSTELFQSIRYTSLLHATSRFFVKKQKQTPNISVGHPLNSAPHIFSWPWRNRPQVPAVNRLWENDLIFNKYKWSNNSCGQQ